MYRATHEQLRLVEALDRLRPRAWILCTAHHRIRLGSLNDLRDMLLSLSPAMVRSRSISPTAGEAHTTPAANGLELVIPDSQIDSRIRHGSPRPTRVPEWSIEPFMKKLRDRHGQMERMRRERTLPSSTPLCTPRLECLSARDVYRQVAFCEDAVGAGLVLARVRPKTVSVRSTRATTRVAPTARVVSRRRSLARNDLSNIQAASGVQAQ